MLRREDRRDLGWLGLWVAVYGLACAPVLHAIYGHGGGRPLSASAAVREWISPARAHAPEAPRLPLATPHDERVPHSHAPEESSEPGKAPSGHTHGPGSVEHLQALALPALVPPPLAVIWVGVGPRLPGQERPREGEPPRPTAMPQAP